MVEQSRIGNPGKQLDNVSWWLGDQCHIILVAKIVIPLVCFQISTGSVKLISCTFQCLNPLLYISANYQKIQVPHMPLPQVPVQIMGKERPFQGNDTDPFLT